MDYGNKCTLEWVLILMLIYLHRSTIVPLLYSFKKVWGGFYPMHVKQFVWGIVCHSNFFGHAEKVSKKLKFNAAKFFASKEDGLNVIQNIQNIQNLKEDAAVLIH